MKTRSVNKGSGGFAVTPEKFGLIEKALLASMPRNATGITFKDLVRSVAGGAPKELFPKKGSIAWYTKVVQLDLEARGVIERIPGVTPQRIRRARRRGA